MSAASQTDFSFWKASKSRSRACARRAFGVTTVTPAAWPSASFLKSSFFVICTREVYPQENRRIGPAGCRGVHHGEFELPESIDAAAVARLRDRVPVGRGGNRGHCAPRDA